MLNTTLTPSAIVGFLDQYVIGQDDAKRTVAVAVYTHFRKIAKSRRDGTPIVKSNLLLVGPSGTGKTLLCRTLSQVLGVPFVTAEATGLAQARFANEEIEALLQRLLEEAGGDVERAQSGIVFIDEIDKLKTSPTQERGVSGESVQHALLKLMEGTPFKLHGGQYLDTTNILFICGGAFIGLSEIMARSKTYGFISTSGEEDRRMMDRINSRIKPTDLFSFGLIPEFTGRLPIVARFEELTKSMLVRIMIEPKDCIYEQFREIFRTEGVELSVDRRVFEQIAEIALEYKTGARSLRGIFEEMVTPVLYTVPDQPEICGVAITSLFTQASYTRGPRRF